MIFSIRASHYYRFFLFATIHAKAFTFGGALDFEIKFAGIKGIELAKPRLKNVLIKNKLKDVNDQTLMLGKVGDK